MRQDQGPTNSNGQPGIVSAALSGSCPQCGAPTLFDGPARFAFTCDNCGLKIAELERGGRLAGLVTIILAIILITIALAIDEAFRPALWLQALVWAPLTIGMVIGALRLFKTALLYRQYQIEHGDGEP